MSWKESESDRLRKQLSEQTRVATAQAERAARAEAAEREALANAAKARKETARIKRRVHAGVCPCCNRTFQNLARHMQTKHKAAP